MITLKIAQYSLDTGSTAGRDEYLRIKQVCKDLDHRLFKVIAPDHWKTVFPDAVVIEESYLFSEQYNTTPETGNLRLHDWFEGYFDEYSKRRAGYYLYGDDLPALRELQARHYVCGYCGHRYQGEDPPAFCDQCLGSIYLRGDELYLLRMVSLAAEREQLREPQRPRRSLRVPLTEAEHAELYPKWEAAQRITLEKKRQKKIADAAVKAELDRRKWMVEDWLLRNAIDTENVIYYSHKDEWCWGWRTSLKPEEAASLKERLRAIFSAELFERMTFKIASGIHSETRSR